MAATFRTTQGAVLVAIKSSATGLRNTQAAALVAGRLRFTPFMRSTQAAVDVIGRDDTATILATQSGVLVAVRATPDFRWVNMVMQIRFPPGVSDGSEVVGRFNTDRQQVRSGYRQSLSYWGEGLNRFDVAKGIDTMQQMLQLDAFHRIVKGAGNPFLFRNPIDYTSAGFTGQDIQVISATDQKIGTGDGVTKIFQVIKNYTFDDGEHPIASAVKTITHVISSTFVLAVSTQTVTNYTLAASVACVTFIARASVKDSDISFESSGGRNLILSVSTDFTVFQVGDALQITGSTVNLTTSVSTDHVQTITSVASTLVRITAVGSTFTTEAAGGTITVNVHPAPRSGQAITTGFWYDTPAAFQTDEIPLRLSQYHIGEAQVLVEEVRVETSC